MSIPASFPAVGLLFFAFLCCGNDPRPVTPELSYHSDTLPPRPSLARDKDLKSNAEEAVDKEKSGVPNREESASAPPPPARRHTLSPDFTDIQQLNNTVMLDIRYATLNNFTKKQIYDCPRCLLRPAVAEALVRVHTALQKKGYGLKVFDCYRPRPYQQRLWDAVPNPNYVTPPAKGSMHSRGAAVDLTLVNAAGQEVDMGTPYDFFGREAHTDYLTLPADVLANRKRLRDAMAKEGFQGIRTEWWHFSYRGSQYPLSDYVWDCP